MGRPEVASDDDGAAKDESRAVLVAVNFLIGRMDKGVYFFLVPKSKHRFIDTEAGDVQAEEPTKRAEKDAYLRFMTAGMFS